MSNDVSSADDLALIRQIKAGNKMAFNTLFDRYWQDLYAFAFSLYKQKDLVDDCLQEVFAAIWERRDSQEIKNPKAYLFQAVRFQVASQIRKIKLDESTDAIINSLNYADKIQHQIDLKELQHQIDGVVEGLPRRCAEIFRMSRFDHLSNKEIAAQLSISIRSVENQITTALQKIRVRLHKDSLILLFTLLIGNA